MKSSISNFSNEQAENTILLVDDEQNVIRSLKRLLRKEGYKILTANSGQEGLQVLKDNSIGVILSDQRMPGMSGVEFLSQVKELYPDTIRIVLSGYTELSSITDAINHGAIYKFFTKPWEDELLTVNIRDAFKNYGLHKENKRLTEELGRLNEKLENRVEEQNHESQLKLKMLQFTQQVMDIQPVGILGISNEDVICISNQQAHEFLSKNGRAIVMKDLTQVLPESICEIYYQVKEKGCKLDKRINLDDKKIRIIGKKITEYGQNIAHGVVMTLIEL